MNNKIDNYLEEAIMKEFEILKNTSDKITKSEIIDNIARMYNLKIEKTKIEKEIKNQNLEKYLGYTIQVGLTIGSWVMYDIWQRRGFKFEENGSIGSPWVRNLISKIIPK